MSLRISIPHCNYIYKYYNENHLPASKHSPTIKMKKKTSNIQSMLYSTEKAF